MRLTVLNVAFPFAPVGTDTAGGAEQVVSSLDRALVERGHRSLVLAAAGSNADGALITMEAPAGTLTPERRQRAHREYARRLREIFASRDVDVVHMHGVDFAHYLPPAGVPLLVTLHLPIDWYAPHPLSIARPLTFVHCVSASQRTHLGDQRGRGGASTDVGPGLAGAPSVRLLDDIPNGVPVDALATDVTKRGFVMALGRICPEKGFHLAADAARLAACPLLVAGAVFPYPEHIEYFERELRPRCVDGCRFIGPIGFARKRRLLSAARALLVPSLAPETSSLVAMEALACGTPVIAFPSGALPDIVDHGRTGFLVRSVDEMAEAIRSATTIDRAACRAAARARFRDEIMIDRYLAVYRRLAACRAPLFNPTTLSMS